MEDLSSHKQVDGHACLKEHSCFIFQELRQPTQSSSATEQRYRASQLLSFEKKINLVTRIVVTRMKQSPLEGSCVKSSQTVSYSTGILK